LGSKKAHPTTKPKPKEKKKTPTGKNPPQHPKNHKKKPGEKEIIVACRYGINNSRKHTSVVRGKDQRGQGEWEVGLLDRKRDVEK